MLKPSYPCLNKICHKHFSKLVVTNEELLQKLNVTDTNIEENHTTEILYAPGLDRLLTNMIIFFRLARLSSWLLR